MRRMWMALLAGAMATLVAAGCGGGDDDGGETGAATEGAATPDAAVEAYFTDLGEGDGTATCAQLTTEAQEEPPWPLSLATFEGGTCEQAVETWASANPGGAKDYAGGDVPIEIVKESAEEATVRADDPAYDYTLVNEDGVWKIESSVLAPEK